MEWLRAVAGTNIHVATTGGRLFDGGHSDADDDQQQSPAWQRARRNPYALGLMGNAQNLVRRNSAGVGGFGGSCLCPNGQIYMVGDWRDGCGSLACIGAGGSSRPAVPRPLGQINN